MFGHIHEAYGLEQQEETVFLNASNSAVGYIYPQPVQWFIQAMPLWHGVELMRQLSIGAFSGATWMHLGYFVVMSVAGMVFCTVRLRALFLR